MITPEQAMVIYNAGPDAVVENICELSRKFDLQQKRAEALERKVARLLKNSSNSSKPPSSDITKPKTGKRGKGKRKIGAQTGHSRHKRPLFPKAEIDKFHNYRLSACPECDNPDVTFLDSSPRVIQQMELKKVLLIKEEHRSYPVWCERCGKIHYHSFPEHVVKEGLFKERLTSLVAYMKAVDHASYSTIRKFIRDGLIWLAPTPTGCRADSKSFFGTLLFKACRSTNTFSLNKTCFSPSSRDDTPVNGYYFTHVLVPIFRSVLSTFYLSPDYWFVHQQPCRRFYEQSSKTTNEHQ